MTSEISPEAKTAAEHAAELVTACFARDTALLKQLVDEMRPPMMTATLVATATLAKCMVENLAHERFGPDADALALWQEFTRHAAVVRFGEGDDEGPVQGG